LIAVLKMAQRRECCDFFAISNDLHARVTT
jgi:hypothetical protein